MAWKGIKHKVVGSELDRTEFESEEGHELANGTTLPATGNEDDGDMFFKTDTKRLYIYVS